ncbi:MAG: killer suppression protein [Clostridia bacterium]|nr:killer suppression protein [Clostridia bacterium]
MRILFVDEDLMLACTHISAGRRRWGADCAKIVARRLDELGAASVLEDVRHLRGARCHELTGDRLGTLSVHAKEPFRLIFRPADDPVPRKPDGGLEWAKVKSIIVLEVVDYH